jgi:uncharacterized protein
MSSATRSVSVGLISDTHGLLRPQALHALRGSRHIVHAGDIGNPAILDGLRAIAPVTAVRGNNDVGVWARALPHTARLEIGGMRLLVMHDVRDVKGDPGAEGIRVVVAGHSHRPSAERRGGVLYCNPGSAGPRRFKLPVAVARLKLAGASVRFQLVELDHLVR